MKYAGLCVVNGSTLGYSLCFLLDSIELIVQFCFTVCPEDVQVCHLRLVAVTAPLPTRADPVVEVVFVSFGFAL
jgi:hypothetical protein